MSKSEQGATRRRSTGRRVTLSAWVAAALAGAAGALAGAAGAAQAPAADAAAAFVGREACTACHRAQAERWRGSDHDLAMQEAQAESVLGNFDDASFTYAGTTTRFFKRAGKYLVRTDGPDGELHDYPVAYTFGVRPLQQYLIELPGGRLQALGIAWDSRPKSAGGQRWFHLYPGESVRHDDVLHWTRPSQSWNSMCADCHSTGLRRGYDLEADRYATRWSEIDVSCEACHGPGSRHVAWARAGAAAAEADRGLVVRLAGPEPAKWTIDATTGIARRSPPRSSTAEIEACAPCHSRRSAIRDPAAPDRPFLDSYRPALLDAFLYHPDGQIDGEVYEHGSFLQSRMYRAGVTCSDCHDPHDLRVRAEGNALCARCHAPAKFDTPEHHHHGAGSSGARCIACHMPAKTYMGIDQRRDHSLRVPRPDLGVRLGTPDPCTECHAGRTPAWAAETIAGWPGTHRWREPHWADALAAGRSGTPGAAAQLVRLVDDSAQPGIVRATAASLLGAPATAIAPDTREALGRALADTDPLVRMGALEALAGLDPAARSELGAPLLADRMRAVRLGAVSALASVPPASLPPEPRQALDAGLAEYREAQLAQSDRPEAHVDLGILAISLGDPAAAERELHTALRLGPQLLPAYVNLADLYRLLGRDAEGEPLLRRAIAVAPQEAAPHHALGLLLVRRKRLGDAIAELERAAALAPGEARYAYVLGVALHEAGRGERALEVLREAHQRRPGDRDLLIALVTISRDRAAHAEALQYARELLELDPSDAAARRLLGELQAQR